MPQPPLYIVQALKAGGDTLFLPPAFEIIERRRQGVPTRPIPFGSKLRIQAVQDNQGTELDFRINAPARENANARAIIDAIEGVWAFCRGRLVDVLIYNDRGWPECALQSFEHPHGPDPKVSFRGFSMSFLSAYSAPVASLQIPIADEAAYQALYPWWRDVGRLTGAEAQPDTGGGSYVPEILRLSFFGVFSGHASVGTPAGQEIRFQLPGTAGRQWVLRSLRVTNAAPYGSTGASVVRLSRDGVGATENLLAATVAQGAWRAQLRRVSAGPAASVYGGRTA